MPSKILKVLDQTGKRKSINKDRLRSALKPGKRVTSRGTIYWETRKNRSDMPGKRL